jgi:hypothetical protein
MFLNSLIEIDRIEVKIEFLFKENSEEFHASIRYILMENGYPDEVKKLGAVCDPTPKLANGQELNGVNLRSILI